jgi:hypothetical protein
MIPADIAKYSHLLLAAVGGLFEPLFRYVLRLGSSEGSPPEVLPLDDAERFLRTPLLALVGLFMVLFVCSTSLKDRGGKLKDLFVSRVRTTKVRSFMVVDRRDILKFSRS